MVEQNRLFKDTDSIAKFGSRQDSFSSTLNVSDADALSIAEQRLAQFSRYFCENRWSYSESIV